MIPFFFGAVFGACLGFLTFGIVSMAHEDAHRKR